MIRCQAWGRFIKAYAIPFLNSASSAGVTVNGDPVRIGSSFRVPIGLPEPPRAGRRNGLRVLPLEPGVKPIFPSKTALLSWFLFLLFLLGVRGGLWIRYPSGRASPRSQGSRPSGLTSKVTCFA